MCQILMSILAALTGGSSGGASQILTHPVRRHSRGKPTGGTTVVRRYRRRQRRCRADRTEPYAENLRRNSTLPGRWKLSGPLAVSVTAARQLLGEKKLRRISEVAESVSLRITAIESQPRSSRSTERRAADA